MISYGIHLSASGALTSMHRQDVITNNLANARTPGFKPDIALQIARDPARIEDGLGHLPSNQLLEHLGGGTHVLPTIVSYAQGVLEQTDRPLDLAIRGEGFFAVRDAAASRDGGDGLRLTRDGRMTRSADGVLVTAADGLPVLSADGRPIPLPPGPEPTVEADGTITQDGLALGRIALLDVDDRRALEKHGAGLFALAPGDESRLREATGRIESGYVEAAAVDEIAAMMGVTSASRAAQTNIAMIEYHDRMMEQAIRTFGRVA